jgi:ATP-dependent DNA helicase RecG
MQILGGLIDRWRLGLGLFTSGESACYFGEGLEAKVPKAHLRKKISEGGIQIVVGTHALIQKNINFHKLALTVIDEQHRFGVKQRDVLLKNKKIIPHFLSMSATPIPRTLALTIFSDLDLSIIDELPGGRRPILTKIVAPANRPRAYQFVRAQIKKGRQAFVICPRIELESQGTWADAKAVKEEYERLKNEVFPDLKVVMLHGKMKAMEKDQIMQDFHQNKTNVLVATSVIEVGVDIANATIMVIEGAERFGLAQLYQFRGRVGRGEHQSFCFLFTDSPSATVHQRLNSLLEARNGFELAEKDLTIRGPGEFLGQSQTGLPDLAMRSLGNLELVKKSRSAALQIIQSDPELKNYLPLKKKMEQFQQKTHLE